MAISITTSKAEVLKFVLPMLTVGKNSGDFYYIRHVSNGQGVGTRLSDGQYAPWGPIENHIPYEGSLVLQNKAA